MANKIDSNVTGLRFAEETDIKVLPGSPVWYGLEPNGYNDFGGQLTLLSRNPINPSRQRKKGVITDLDASGGFGQDFTQTNFTRLLQGILFADIRQKASNLPMNGTQQPFTGVTATDDTYTLGAGTVGSAFAANDLLFASGFGQAANNGLKVVASSTATTIVVGDGLVDETPPATAKVQKVGAQLASATLNVVVSGSYPRLTRASGTKDFTTFGLIPGEWIFIGGDLTTERFTNANNNGFARVRAVGADYIELDKTAAAMAAETGTGKTIRLFFGNVIKNEKDPNLIKRRTYQLERTLGQDANGTMSEYLTGAVPNEFSFQVRQADKITADLSFVAVDNEQRTGTQGVKSGTRPDVVESPAFNTSSDFSRIKLHVITDGNTAPTPLFAFLTELTVTVNNNVSPNKAIAVLGAFDVTAGTFAVSGQLTAYFSSIEAVQAVRNNADVTLDFALVKANAGFVFDLPLIALGDGRLNVEQDQPITLPLTTDAAEGAQGHTLLINEFPYLPSVADV
ncbi:minor tail protein [Stenotrophomonas phage vB_SmaS_Bhz59]